MPVTTAPRLSDAQVKHYTTEGYLIVPDPIFPESKFNGLKDHFEQKLSRLPADVQDRMHWGGGERADVHLGALMITLFTRAIYEDEVDLPEEGFLHPAQFTDARASVGRVLVALSGASQYDVRADGNRVVISVEGGTVARVPEGPKPMPVAKVEPPLAPKPNPKRRPSHHVAPSCPSAPPSASRTTASSSKRRSTTAYISAALADEVVDYLSF